MGNHSQRWPFYILVAPCLVFLAAWHHFSISKSLREQKFPPQFFRFSVFTVNPEHIVASLFRSMHIGHNNLPPWRLILLIKSVQQSRSNMVCQTHRYSISDLFECQGSWRNTFLGFKIVIIRECLYSGSFTGCYWAVLLDVRMDKIVPIPSDMGNNRLCMRQISGDDFKSVQERCSILMCPEIRWQIYIWHPGTVFVPCIHNNPINLQSWSVCGLAWWNVTGSVSYSLIPDSYRYWPS